MQEEHRGAGCGLTPSRSRIVTGATVPNVRSCGRKYHCPGPTPAVPTNEEKSAITCSSSQKGRWAVLPAADRLAAVWRLALASGLRRGELVGVCWDDIDGLSIRVARQVLMRPSGGRGRVFVRETTKTRRVRRVGIDEATGAALRRWRAEQAEERLAFGGAWKKDGGLGVEAAWIVTEPDGCVIRPNTLLERWKRLVRSAGVTPIGLHGARHSYAELALSVGVRLDVVSRQLGHASINTTANIYTHDSDEATREAARQVGAALGEGGR
jgi:integrase